MREYRAKLGEDGRIVIPAIYRRELHLEPGEELIIRMDNNELHILSSKQSLKRAQLKVRELTKGASLVEKLKALREEDNNNE